AQPGPDGVVPVTNMMEPYLFLVRDPYVHELLDLTKKQRVDLQSLNDKADPKIWMIRNRSAEEAANVNGKLIAITRREIKKVLDDQQLERLFQIEMWTQGVRSLLRDDVITSLRISKSQATEIQGIIAASEVQKADLRKKLQSGGDHAKLNQQYKDVQIGEQEQILKILTQPQQQQWVAMLGPRVELNKLGRVKFKAPEFPKSASWINSPELTLDKLKGKVVALHFYAFA
ncbi:MAG: hypothetical protein KDB27_31055, partial [Planctomycetales bacterium]|nr:hypothetical protein [Planctomycetales bacterium]